MQKNKLYLKNDSVIRGLEERDGKILVIDCMRRTIAYCEANRPGLRSKTAVFRF